MRRGSGRLLLLIPAVSALVSACSLPDLLGLGPPPLARDLQSLCLKSHLRSKAFHALADQTPGLEKSRNAPEGDKVPELWAHRLAGRGLMVSFIASGGMKDGDYAHGACILDDVQDKQATIRWLSRWTGAQVPPGKFVKYYLVVGPDRPKLLPVASTEIPPTDGQGTEVYMLRVDSTDTNTDLTIVR